MRISDWSSDVCSSDLQGPEQCFTQPVSRYGGQEAPWQDAVRIDIFNGKRRRNSGKPIKALQHAKSLASTIAPAKAAEAAIGGDLRWVRPPGQTGRGAGRERGGQEGEDSVGSVS